MKRICSIHGLRAGSPKGFALEPSSMRRPISKRPPKSAKPKPPPSRFAPAAFLRGTPEAVQKLCDDLATQAAGQFADLGTKDWRSVGTSIVQQLRAIGHDLGSFDDTDELQEWQATWHHPSGTFSLFLSFRSNGTVEVTWRVDDVTYTARA